MPKEKGMLTGTCKFCGLTQMVEAETEEEADKAVVADCTCEEGLSFRGIIAAEEVSKRLFTDFPDETIGFVNRLVSAVSCGVISSGTIKLNGITKATVSMTNKDKVKILRSDTEATEEEI